MPRQEALPACFVVMHGWTAALVLPLGLPNPDCHSRPHIASRPTYPDCHSREGGDPFGFRKAPWIPAYAGMTDFRGGIP